MEEIEYYYRDQDLRRTKTKVCNVKKGHKQLTMATCDDGKTEQECLKCHIVKPVSYYHKNQRTCKGCIGLYHEWRKINKENIDRVKKELKQSRDEFFAKHLGLGQEPAVKDEESK